MMGKISKGGSFGGCVDYVTRKKKDNPDGTPCKEWRLIDCKDVSVIEGREGIIESFEDNLALNPSLKNPVGHISLNFHANDKDNLMTAAWLCQVASSPAMLVVAVSTGHLTADMMKEAVQLIDGRAQTECSGNITKENIAKICEIGVDFVSSGALTHSAPILDISMKNLHPVEA